MRTQLYSNSKLVAVAVAAFATLFLVACQSSPRSIAPAKEMKADAGKEVFVVFEGPWAFVDDPKDSNSVLALAPKTKLHRDLYVTASNSSTLASGVYELSVPAHGPAFSGALDSGFAQAKIDAKSLQRALDDKAERYVIRLPKPEAYVAAKRDRSRVGPSYPPDASTEQLYATFVSLRYNVGSLNGFSLAGSPDSGAFNPLLLQLETPHIRFAIEPAQFDDMSDTCDLHSRESFRSTTKFLGLKLYVEFPGYTEDCRKTDPQMTRMRGESGIRRVELLPAMVEAYPVARDLAAYFFHADHLDCHAPVLFLTIGP